MTKNESRVEKAPAKQESMTDRQFGNQVLMIGHPKTNNLAVLFEGLLGNMVSCFHSNVERYFSF